MKEKCREGVSVKIIHQILDTGFTGEFGYDQARAACRPDGFAILTTQPARLSGSDIYYGLEMKKSYDGGKTWTAFEKCRNLNRQPWEREPGTEQVICDATPFYHKATGKLILTGINVVYINDEYHPEPSPHDPVWSVYDEEAGDWTEFHCLVIPGADQDAYYACGSGCCQILELDNGELLIPVYYMCKEDAQDSWHHGYSAVVLRCGFDGKDLTVLEVGDSLTIPVPRGLCEPSIVCHQGTYFLALRNDEDGYVAKSVDGLHYETPVPLCYDDGSSVGNYCTQQHWITGGGKLWLVYTRRGADNDHIFRHRAPLFIAEFDPERMCLIRETEQIAVPNRGAPVGNYGCTHVSDKESWVVAAEEMNSAYQTKDGCNNSIFVSKITFD